jgi:hypothetical protein
MSLVDTLKTADERFEIRPRQLAEALMAAHLDNAKFGILQIRDAYLEWKERISPGINRDAVEQDLDRACALMDFYDVKKLELAKSGKLKGLKEYDVQTAYLKLEQQLERIAERIYPYMGYGYRRNTFKHMTGYEYKNPSKDIFDRDTHDEISKGNLKDERRDIALDSLAKASKH